MYFVDRTKIEQTLVHMENLLKAVESLKECTSTIEQLALERATHIVIESMMDVGNAIIDGFIMRDPGSYEDILDIFWDEKVLTESEAASLKQVVSLRKMLVQQFIDVDHAHLQEVLTKQASALSTFSSSVRRYLEKELGPVSAFLPENH
ncbi:hypothetical protein A374_02949 [Fictibacillus macauensis ZFHKF-1]|uniref:DUF86 domain-containing protein n=1 Tax=Fictibacillus macauensis ZFHKF-1 TaxID=1196324 RepID=I8AMH3_9BACL|nr:DUF86 domain-containing protein [Fictibacillus macauensis]EIT87177.1 hypothetical protein A374_02949 [Fictibacillus macauensis ZFHKF-1]